MGKTLVAYWSQSGTTRRAAQKIATAASADLYEVQVDRTYDDDMWRAWEQAQAERAADDFPSVTGEVPDLNVYDTIIIGSPAWGYMLSNPIQAFLRTVDLSGKHVCGFWTFYDHDEECQHTLTTLATGARVTPGLPCPRSLMAKDRRLDAAIATWLADLQA